MKKEKIKLIIVNILHIIILIPALLLGILIASTSWTLEFKYPYHNDITLLFVVKNTISFIPSIIMVIYTIRLIKQNKTEFQSQQKNRKNILRRLLLQAFIMFILFVITATITTNWHEHDGDKIVETKNQTSTPLYRNYIQKREL